MNIEKFAPWNWFKKEEEESTQIVPVRHDRGLTAYPAPFPDIQREFDRLLELMQRSVGREWPSLLPERSPLLTPAWFKPSLDIASDEKAYTIKIELPGIDAADVTIEVEGGTLKVKGEKRQEKEEREKDFYRIERSYGTFQRILDIPDDAVTDDISSSYKDGVLSITVPRKALPKKETKKVEIETTS